MIWVWASAMILAGLLFVFPYVGYPLVLRLSRPRYPIGQAPAPQTWPSVSLIIAAYNARDAIATKVKQMRAHDYPGPLEIIVSDDGSQDGTADSARQAGADVVLRLPRSGKSEAQNAAVAVATGEILVFTDVTVVVQPGALRHLVAELLTPGVGCVTGVDVSVAANESDAAEGAGFYTRFETFLRTREAQTGSLLGVNGCLFAVRKTDRASVPRDAVDDLYVPLAVIDRGLRVTLHPEAKAVVARAKTFGDEYRRKVRTFAGGIFTVGHARRDLPRAWQRQYWRLVGHKWLRWLGPLFVILGLYASVGLAWRWPWGWLIVAAEAAIVTAALLGITSTAAGRQTHRVVRVPAFLALVQFALVHAWYRVVVDDPYVTWRPTRREQ